MKLGKYSMGIGDRFGHQGKAQLQALQKAAEKGVVITPVWNKSYREHHIVKSNSVDTRRAADSAVKSADWLYDYFVDADHIRLNTVDEFIEHCDFFTLDVADDIGKTADDKDIEEFVEFCNRFIDNLRIPGINENLQVDRDVLVSIAHYYLNAVIEAGKIGQLVCHKVKWPFVMELSIDETRMAQKPVELFFILAATAWIKLPIDTIAPKFTGRFNKGVDYVGDLKVFTREFEQDIFVIRYAIQEFDLSSDLKLSVHSGSDKFSIYPIIRDLIRKHDVGLHIKTAGTTWLEELIGLASANGSGLRIVKDIYQKAYGRYDELAGPYATVLDIDKNQLPTPETVNTWTSEQYAATLRHIQSNQYYNPHFRQLLHVAYKVAAELSAEFYNALQEHEDIIAENVTENLFDRHISALFL